jgi:uncharacterized protein (DUF169 family)
MSNLSQLNESLVASLRLAQPPVAICLTDSLPAGVQTWSGNAPAGCRFWQEAATKVFATTARDHDLCSIGIHTHNLGHTSATEKDLGLALKVMGDLGYVRAEDIPQIPVLAKAPKYVIYGPLASIPVTPDVVLLFVEANQTLILSEAAQQLEGGNPPAMGRPACAVVSQAKNTSKAALSLGCCGARAYLDVLTDDVALFAIPGDKLEQFTERIVALAQANDILTKFHTIRRAQVAAGGSPSVEQTLQAMGA